MPSMNKIHPPIQSNQLKTPCQTQHPITSLIISHPQMTLLPSCHEQQPPPPRPLEKTSPHSPNTLPAPVSRLLRTPVAPSLIFPLAWPFTLDRMVPGLVPKREGGLE